MRTEIEVEMRMVTLSHWRAKREKEEAEGRYDGDEWGRHVDYMNHLKAQIEALKWVLEGGD